MALHLSNPHSLLAALETRPRDVLEVRLSSDKPGGVWSVVAEQAARHRVPIVRQNRPTGRRQNSSDAKGGRSGHAVGLIKPRSPVTLSELFTIEEENSGNGSRLWLGLDTIQDPHNVGAIFRTAAFFGIEGVVLTRDRSASLTETVYDIASGGLEYVPFAIETNLSRTLKQAKESGLWVLGASEHAATDLKQIDRDRPWLLVLGNEEKGLRRLTRENCDEMCRLTPRGAIQSLNVSVAAAVLMSHFCG